MYGRKQIKSIMFTQSKAIAKGVFSLLPKADNLLTRESAKSNHNLRYCYSVWLRHLVKLHESSGKNVFPSMVELGPGSSIATGILALLTGTNNYLALDVVDFTKGFNYEEILEELILLISNKTPIPGEKEFPDVYPKLDDYSFPNHILTDSLLKETLSTKRIATIKSIIKEYNVSKRFASKDGISIQYMDEWTNKLDKLPVNFADLVLSHGVLMMVTDLDMTYKMVSKFLKKGGVTSHQIDFGSLNTADKWNGHWTYSDFTWKLIMGQRSFLINRAPLQEHVDLHKEYKMKIMDVRKIYEESEISRTDLSNRFMGLSDEDLITRTALIQAMKE